MKNDFDLLDEMMIMQMLHNYITQCIQEQTYSQEVINEMVKSKAKLSNLLKEVVEPGL